MIGIRDDAAPAAPPPSRAPELAAKIFSEGGWLQGALDLEHRAGQERMANAVAAAFRDDEPLLFEAGTGIGKSLAYLAPGIIHATDCGRQLIVSTHTISLQEQIDRKDLPLCRRLFNVGPTSPGTRDSSRHGACRQIELPLHLEALPRPGRAGQPV